MKYYRLTIGAIALFLVASNVSYSQKKTVALVSFYCDRFIEHGGPNMASFLNDPKYDLKPLVEKAYNQFVKDYAKNFPFTIAPHSELLAVPEYSLFKTRFLADSAKASKTLNKILGMNQYVLPKGFVLAYGRSSETIKKENFDPYILAQLLGKFDGVMVVSLDYEFREKAMGFACGMLAYMTIGLFDKDGNKVFMIREFSTSKGKVPAVGGVPILKTEKVVPLCQDATNVLFSELKGKLPKIIKKTAKKF